MKKIAIFALLLTCLVACKDKDKEQADMMLQSVETAIQKGDYRTAMDSIVKLRADYPKQIEARKKALDYWNQAQLLQAQHEIAHSDSLMMVIDQRLSQPGISLLERNTLKYRKDSLQARYNVNCAIVRKIKMKNQK